MVQQRDFDKGYWELMLWWGARGDGCNGLREGGEGGKTETERKRDRETERQTERQRETERERLRERASSIEHAFDSYTHSISITIMPM